MACDSTDSALLIVDLQLKWSRDDYIKRDYPNFKENVQKLVDFARRNHMLIIHIYADYNEDDTLWYDKGFLPFRDNPPDLDIVQPLEHEKIIHKSTANAFYKTTLDEYLRSKRIRRVYGCGLVTSVCVLNTIHGAYNRGYETFVVGDCCADYPVALHHLIIDRYSRNHTWKPVRIADGLKECGVSGPLRALL